MILVQTTEHTHSVTTPLELGSYNVSVEQDLQGTLVKVIFT